MDVLTIVHDFADLQTKGRLAQCCKLVADHHNRGAPYLSQRLLTLLLHGHVNLGNLDNFVIDNKDTMSYGSSLFTYAILNDTNMCLYLIRRGAVIHESTITEVAKKRNYVVLDAILQSAQCEYDAGDLAYHAGDIETYLLLRDHPAVDTDALSRTLLLTKSVVTGDDSMVAALLSAGARPNANCITLARARGYTNIVDLLRRATSA